MKGPISRAPRLRARRRACQRALLAAAVLAAPTVLRAQGAPQPGDSAPRLARSAADSAPDRVATLAADSATAPSHLVERGETLWSLAQSYLASPSRWPEIYRLNTTVVENPHWIYPGEVLRLPGGAAPADGAEPADQAAPAGEAASPADLDAADDPDPATGTTVFSAASGASEPRAMPAFRSVGEEPRPAVRAGEFYAAPWVDRPGGPAQRGRIVALTEIAGIVQASQPTRLQLGDRAYIALPKMMVPAAGDRLVAFTTGPELGGGQVVIPTGIVVVERADNGDATTVRVVQQFDEMRVGDGIMPLPRAIMAAEARPAPLQLGVQGRILWIPSRAVLPSLQRYVVLSVTTVDGVKPGDQFTVLRPRVQVEGSDVILPEEPIALLQIVRVTERGATGIIVDQRHPAIKAGMLARQTARMP